MKHRGKALTTAGGEISQAQHTYPHTTCPSCSPRRYAAGFAKHRRVTPSDWNGVR